jgi:hypothetical protein
MLIGLSLGEEDVWFNVLAGWTFSFVLFDGGGTRGERREGVNVGALLMRAGIDLRWPFLGGIVN